MKHKVDGERLRESLHLMAENGATATGGVNRLSLNPANRQARDLLVYWMKQTGLDVKIDPIGNIFGVLKGRTDEVIMAGSHLDSVSDAGIFDGALGVLGALEAARVLTENGVEPEKSYAVACFTNEEGARFQPDMMGSMVLTGKLPLAEALEARDDTGVTVEQELRNSGYSGSDTVTPSAYLELHVEQGPQLHRESLEIGVVEGVQGIAWYHGTYTGEANHAGTTPIPLRHDALLGAAELCVGLRALAVDLGHGSVSTMGRLSPDPDIINVVPGKASFTVDFRQYNQEVFNRGKEQVDELVRVCAERHGLGWTLRQSADAQPVRFNPVMVDLVEKKTREQGYNYKRMPSAAGHDAQFLSYMCPTAMIFVPSVDGRSHCPEERTTFKDCVNGANVLLGCVQELCG